MDESPLSPQKEVDYRTVIKLLEEINASQREENANLKQELANYKKLIYGQKSEKTEVVLENGEQMSFFDEAEENANKEVREKENDDIRRKDRKGDRRD